MENLKEKFIVSDELQEKKIEQLIEIFLPFCKVTESGSVIVEDINLSNKNKVHLVIVARYLANKLDSKISSEVNIDEISEWLIMPKNQVRARLQDLKDRKKIHVLKRGVFEANFSRIGDLVNDLKKIHGDD